MILDMSVMGLAIGLCTGILSGMLGVGGGIVLVPALVVFLALPQHMAQGISLLVIIPTALVGAWTLHKKGLVKLRLVAYLAAGSTLGSLIGARLAQDIPGDQLKRLFGTFVIIIASRMLLTVYRSRCCGNNTNEIPPGGNNT